MSDALTDLLSTRDWLMADGATLTELGVDDPSSCAQSIRAHRVIIHPDYKNDSVSFGSDVALIDWTSPTVITRFVPAPEGRAGFRETVDAHGKRLYRILEQQASGSRAAGPWFLGGRLTAVDIYLGAMTFWRPGRDWFDAETPRLAAIGRAVRAHDRFGNVWTRNFPDEMTG